MNRHTNQLEHAKRLSALINALRFSWVELSGEHIEATMNIALEYAKAMEKHLTEMAEGEK
ncbi:hypothetical protein ACIU3Q_003029 [Salmonella enterica subsp. enterica serovar Kokomlemle]